jgi:hypothetical protein
MADAYGYAKMANFEVNIWHIDGQFVLDPAVLAKNCNEFTKNIFRRSFYRINCSPYSFANKKAQRSRRAT